MGSMENSVKPHENKMGTMPMTRLILTMSLPAIFSMTPLTMPSTPIRNDGPGPCA